MEKYTMNDIAGYKKEKEELAKIIDILNNKEEYFKKGGYIPKGLILYGEPGNGKTLFAKVLASECNVKFYEFDCSKKHAQYRLKKLFNTASKNAPAIVFIDEITRLVQYDHYNNETRKNLATLLTLIDGFDSKKRNQVFVIATANDYDDLPEALIRPGRMDKKIFVDSPDFESRKAVLRFYINQTNCTFNIDEEKMSKLTLGLSNSAIKTLINECVLESDKNNIVDENIFIKNINEINSEDLDKKLADQDLKIVATYELGKFIVARSFSDGDYTLNLNNNGSSSGNIFFGDIKRNYSDDDDEYDDDDYEDESDDCDDNEPVADRSIFSKGEMEKLMQINYGAIIANILFNDGPYTFDYNYIMENSVLALNALSCGFLGVFDDYVFNDHNRHFSEETLQKRERILRDFKKTQYDKAEKILIDKKDLLFKLLPIILNKRILEKKDIKHIVDPYFND